MNTLSQIDFNRLKDEGMLYVVLPESTGDYEDYLKSLGVGYTEFYAIGEKEPFLFPTTTKQEDKAMQLGNIKIRIKDRQHSECVQKKLLEMGCAWTVNIKQVLHTDKKYLYVNLMGGIIWDNDDYYFLNHHNAEYTFSDEEIGYVPVKQQYHQGEQIIAKDKLPPCSSGFPMPAVKPPKPFVRTRKECVIERMKELAEGICSHVETYETAFPDEWIDELVDLNEELKENSHE